MEAYDRQQAWLELFTKLEEGEASVQSESDWLSTEQLHAQLGV